MERPHSAGRMVVGVISDTHGRLDADVTKQLAGVDHIIHAGDIGSAQVLAALRALAPVTAVRGNCDFEGWASGLPTEAEVTIGGVRILVGHIAGRLRGTMAQDRCGHTARGAGGAAGAAAAERCEPPAIRVVVSGHTHRGAAEERDGVLHLNPGSAGQGRFGHPRTIAKLLIAPTESRGADEPGPPTRSSAVAGLEVEFLVLSSS